MADVFISYKREDAARVRKLVAALREAGLDVWWDEDIPPSAPWEATMARPTPELAVLPFEDLSPTHDKAYFAQGVAEEIQSTLAAVKGIKVLGRTSAGEIGRGKDPRAVRASLGVTHLLEGSTRTSGNGLRVNVRLIDTRDGSERVE